MWFRRVRARAFGPLRDAELELAPGLNVVCGANETAKSSWHAALMTGLVGRRRRATTVADRSFEAQHRPWPGDDAWAVDVAVELDDGRSIEIERDLAAGRASVLDVGLGGRPIDDDLLVDGSPDGSVWLGLDRSTFGATASVRQADILRVASDPTLLRDALGRAASTGSGGASAAAAIEAVAAFRKEHVGTDRRNAVRRLRRAIDDAEAADLDLEHVRAQHARYQRLVAELADARGREADAADAVEAARHAELVAELTELGEGLARAEILAAEFPRGAPSAEGFDEVDEAVAAARDWTGRPPVPTTELPTADELATELAAIPRSPDGPTEVDARVVAAVAHWETAVRELSEWRSQRPSGETPVTDPALLRRAADELAESPPPQEFDPTALEADGARLAELEHGQRRRGRTMSLGALAAVLGVAAMVVVPIAGIALLAVSAAAWFVARRRDRSADIDRLRDALARHEARREVDNDLRQAFADRRRRLTEWLRQAGLPTEPNGLREDADRIDRDTRELAFHERQGAALDARQTAAFGRACQLLEAVGAPADGDPTARLTTLHEQCRARRQQADEASRRPVLQQRLEERKRFDAAVAAVDEEHLRLRTQLRSCAERHQLGHLGDDALVEAIGGLERDARVARRRQVERSERWAELQHLLDGTSLEGLRDRVLAVRERADERAVPSSGPAAVTVDQATRNHQRAEVEVARLEAELSHLGGDAVDLGAAEARAEAAHTELEAVRGLDATLATTVAFLERAQDVAHRALAPVLADGVTRWIGEITDGRYVEARVDPETLDVQLLTGDGQWLPTAVVSHGTTEQVYLLLRIVLTEVLTSGDERCPVLLDDPTVHADDARTTRLLEVLRALSRERQVILFSQEALVRRWAENRCDPDVDRLIDLEDTDSVAARTAAVAPIADAG